MSLPPVSFGMFTTDTHLVVRTWDAWIAEITGIPARQALDRPLTGLVPTIEQRGLMPVLLNVLEHGTVEVLAPALHRYLIPCRPANGSSAFDHMQQRVTIGPVRDEGRITGIVVAIEDVTARVEHERELAERLAECRAPETPSAFAAPAPDISSPDTIDDLTRALGDVRWRVRQAAVGRLAKHGGAIVDALVQTLREQHRDFSVLSSMLDLLALTDIDAVEPLIGLLTDDDVDLRIQAALILGERRDYRAVPSLIAALDDPDANVRFHSIEALGTLRAAEAVDALIGIAERRDFFLAFPAVQALGQIGEVTIAPRLVPLLSDELLRAAVAGTLGELGDEAVARPLVQLLDEPNAPAEVVADALAGLYERYELRYRAGEHIANIVRRSISAQGTQGLLDAVQRVSSDRLPGIARVLGWLGGPAVQRALTRLIGQPVVRAQVVEAMVRYGAGVVDLLVEQLTAEDLDTRQAAAVALGRIGDRRATSALVNSLSDPELVLPAAGALAHIGDSDAFEALLQLLTHPERAVRQAAIAALNSIGHADTPARIVPLLDHPSPLARESAVRIAGYFGYRECVDPMLQRCADPSEPVRRAAVEQLPFFDDPRALAALMTAIAADSPSVRAVAAAALARVDEADARPALLAALNDSDAWVRYFALRSIGSLQSSSAAPAVRRLLECDPAGHVRLAAIDVLGRLEVADAASLLGPLTASPEPDLARAAIRALGHLSETAVKPILQQLLRAGEGWRRVEAVTAVAARGGVEAVSALQWVAAADEAPEVVTEAIEALARLASRDRDEAAGATQALISLLVEPATRDAAIAALARLPARRLADVAAALHHPSPAVRRAAVEALGRMQQPEASRVVESALEDDVPAVRTTAVAELRRLGSRSAAKKLLALARTDPDVGVRHAAVLAVTQQSGEGPAVVPDPADVP
jgi:HEAT repeat protein